MTEIGPAADEVPTTRTDARSTDPFAIAALIAALTPAFCLLGIVFGHVAHHRIRRSGDKGWGLATAGLAVGYAALVITVAAVATFWALVSGGDAAPASAPATADPTDTVFTLATTEGDLPDAVVESAATYLGERLADAGAVAEVAARGHGIVVTFDSPPGAEVIGLLTDASDVAFRPVLALGDPAPSEGAGSESTTDKAAPDSPSDVEFYLTDDVAAAFLSADCRDPGLTAYSSPEGALVACATDGEAKYVLGPVEVPGDAIAEVTAGPRITPGGAETNEVALTLTLDSAGTSAFRDATDRLVGMGPPRNQLALMLDGRVASAPQVNDVIPNGEVLISGGAGGGEMYHLAGMLGYGRANHDWYIASTR